jgi:hypothetical protein
MHTVVETNACLAAAKDAGMSEDERDSVVDQLAGNPQAGEVMPAPAFPKASAMRLRP